MLLGDSIDVCASPSELVRKGVADLLVPGYSTSCNLGLTSVSLDLVEVDGGVVFSNGVDVFPDPFP